MAFPGLHHEDPPRVQREGWSPRSARWPSGGGRPCLARRVGGHLYRLAVLALAFMFCWMPLPAQDDGPSEYALKAAMIHKFAGFVTWPAESFETSTSPVVLTVLGTDPFGSELEDMVQGPTASGRRIVVQRVRDERHLTTCHILFVASSEESRFKEILSRVNGRAVLTVSDTEGFCEQGGIVSFYREGKHIRFQINPTAAEREGIKISSQLLKLARIVKDIPPTEGR
jgi:hypothetical protein